MFKCVMYIGENPFKISIALGVNHFWTTLVTDRWCIHTYPIPSFSVRLFVGKIADDEGQEICAHLHTFLEVTLDKAIITCHTLELRHVGESFVTFPVYQGHNELSLKLGFVKTRESSSGVCGFKLCCCHVSCGTKMIN